MIESVQDLQFGDTIIRTKGMAELLLSTTRHIKDVPILLDVVNANVPALFRLDSLDDINLFVVNVTGYLWNNGVMNEILLQYEKDKRGN